MSMETLLKAQEEGVQFESYHPIKLPPGELGKANIISSFRGRIVLFQDEPSGENYKKGLLKDIDSEVYWIESLNGRNEKVKRRYHVHDLTGLMVQTI